MREQALAVLTGSWREADGFCPPNAVVYPHQWLWDSCFHAIAWSSFADPRGLVELSSCLRGQLPSGFVPHMRYLGPTVSRGPLADRSSYTQPPIYAHAARVLRDRGLVPSDDTVASIGRALDWLWTRRRTDDGLIYIVHPWESGADDSPRWDSWIGLDDYDKERFRAVDRALVGETVFDDEGAGTWSRSFVAAPAAFNALVAHAFTEYAALTGDAEWQRRAQQLAVAMDKLLWDQNEGLWRDQPVVGGGTSAKWPTLDGAFGALSTADDAKAQRALDQLLDPTRFAAPYGLSYVPPGHDKYDPNAYWRGPAWPQLNYMMWVAARRWSRDDVAEAIADVSRRAAVASGFAEYWNPETGRGLGAIPQGWAALAAAYFDYHGALVVVENDDGEIVLIHPTGAPAEAPASLPSNPCAPGEAPEDGAVRMVREMTGLDVEIVREFVTFIQPGTPTGVMNAHGYHARVVGGTVLDEGPEGPVRAYPVDALPAIVPIRVANQRVLAAFLAEHSP